LKRRSSSDGIGVGSARLGSRNWSPWAGNSHSVRLFSGIKSRLAKSSRIQVNSFIIVGTLRDCFRVRAFAIYTSARSSIEDSSKWASILPRNSSNAEEVLSAVSRVSMLGEGASSSSSRALEFTSFVINNNLGSRALWHLVSPSAPSGHLVIGQSRGAVVLVGFSIHALPEDSTVFRVSKCSIKSGAMLGGDWRLQLGSLSTLHKMELSTLL